MESKIYLNHEPGAKAETKPGRYEITYIQKVVSKVYNSCIPFLLYNFYPNAFYLSTDVESLDKEVSEKENEGPIKSENLDTDTSGKPDSTTTPNSGEQILGARRSSGSSGKDGRRPREVIRRR